MKKLVSLLLTGCLLACALLGMAGCRECRHRPKTTTTATCTQPGVETTVCSVCGELLEEKAVEPYGHIYDAQSEENDNNKCRTCDLVQYNVRMTSIPETITLYLDTSEGDSETEPVKALELAVRGVSWYRDTYHEDVIHIKIDFKPTFIWADGDDPRVKTYLAGQYAINEDEENIQDWESEFGFAPQIGAWLAHHFAIQFDAYSDSEPYTIDVGIYETLTYRYEGGVQLISATYATDGEAAD